MVASFILYKAKGRWDVQNKSAVPKYDIEVSASDTSTHGGFSVPRRATEDCFPPLDYNQQRPWQELTAKELHGMVWRFRHRGQPRRHLLNTGWSAFVNKKKLVSGDAVLFLRRTVHGSAEDIGLLQWIYFELIKGGYYYWDASENGTYKFLKMVNKDVAEHLLKKKRDKIFFTGGDGCKRKKTTRTFSSCISEDYVDKTREH